MIPKILHQTWTSKEVPEAWKASEKAWRDWAAESGWEYRLWTDEENEALVREKMPSLSDFYRSSLTYGIQRSHVMRYLYMALFGGMYVDLDMVPKPARLGELVEALKERRAVLAFERHSNDQLYLTTAWMMASPGHPFFDHVLSSLPRQTLGWTGRVLTSAMHFYEVQLRTGSVFLSNQWIEYLKQHPAQEEDSDDPLVLPTSWVRPQEHERSPYFSKPLANGPTWRDWDASLAEYAQIGWRHRDVVLCVLLGILLLVLILTWAFKNK